MYWLETEQKFFKRLANMQEHLQYLEERFAPENIFPDHLASLQILLYFV